ncbi:MAG: hypothetical protein WD599_07120 [Balneolaceae bacterium]
MHSINPEEWIGKSIKSEVRLSTERYQRYNEWLGRTGHMAEKGDTLPPFGQWLYFTEEISDSPLLPAIQSGKYYWYEGTIESESALRIGDDCQMSSRIMDVRKIASDKDSYFIQLNQNFSSDGKEAASEQHQILITDHETNHQDIRSIKYEPDWIHEVTNEQVEFLKKLSPQLMGHFIGDVLTLEKNSGRDSIHLAGPPALVLLLEVFDYHFDSRAASRVTYKAFGLAPAEGPFQIAGRDSDSYVTDLSILTSNRQVLFTASIRWRSTWGTSRF